MNILGSIKSIWEGNAAANELLRQGVTTNTVPDQGLYTLAEQIGTADSDLFVEKCRQELDLAAELKAMPPAWYEKVKFW